MARSVWFALVAICGQTVEQPDFLQDSLPSDAGYRKNLRDLNPMIGSPVIRPLGIRYRSHLEVGGANRILCGKSGTRHDFWCLPLVGSLFYYGLEVPHTAWGQSRFCFKKTTKRRWLSSRLCPQTKRFIVFWQKAIRR